MNVIPLKQKSRSTPRSLRTNDNRKSTVCLYALRHCANTTCAKQFLYFAPIFKNRNLLQVGFKGPAGCFFRPGDIVSESRRLATGLTLCHFSSSFSNISALIIAWSVEYGINLLFRLINQDLSKSRRILPQTFLDSNILNNSLQFSIGTNGLSSVR